MENAFTFTFSQRQVEQLSQGAQKQLIDLRLQEVRAQALLSMNPGNPELLENAAQLAGDDVHLVNALTQMGHAVMGPGEAATAVQEALAYVNRTVDEVLRDQQKKEEQTKEGEEVET